MRRIRIYIHQKEKVVIGRKRYQKNVFMIRDILLKMERRQPNIDIDDNSWDFIFIHWVSDKHKPIWMILNIYQLFSFTISHAKN